MLLIQHTLRLIAAQESDIGYSVVYFVFLAQSQILPENHMRTSPEKIAIHHSQLSETHPIIGLRNLHPKQSGPRWDMHYGLEFGLVRAGKEHRLFFDKSEMDGEAGDVWFCGMWEPHGREIIAIPCEVIVLLIWPPLLARMHFSETPDFCALAPFNAPPKLRPRTSKKNRETMVKFGQQLKQIISDNTPYQKIRLRFALQEILLCIYESWPEAACWSRRAPSAEFAQINQALQLVFESRSFVSTDEAARACGMNRHRFSALFQSWMNIRFSDFSLRHRLHQAAEQLQATSDPIKTITQQWGFADESHFYRIFLKHFGVLPGEYRRRALPVKRPA